jgi:hypothetical protein
VTDSGTATEPVIKGPFAGTTFADAEAEAGHFIVVENLVRLARGQLDFADGGFCEVHSAGSTSGSQLGGTLCHAVTLSVLSAADARLACAN